MAQAMLSGDEKESRRSTVLMCQQSHRSFIVEAEDRRPLNVHIKSNSNSNTSWIFWILNPAAGE
jgi:hypothetical protein